LIGSGELTVTVRGEGTGGRNTEMALAAAIDIAGYEQITICSFATDGDDGVSGCAGGIVNGASLASLEQHGVDPTSSLAENDSATALKSIAATIDIGPTGTNVNDLYIALVQNPK
jgi:glycerate 2-kinase